MAEYNVLNYTEQGGAKTVIGGTLELKGAAFGRAATVTLTSAAAAGDAPTKAEHDALVTDVAAIKAALVAAGLMAST